MDTFFILVIVTIALLMGIVTIFVSTIAGLFGLKSVFLFLNRGVFFSYKTLKSLNATDVNFIAIPKLVSGTVFIVVLFRYTLIYTLLLVITRGLDLKASMGQNIKHAFVAYITWCLAVFVMRLKSANLPKNLNTTTANE